jgi:hypothetical protein
VTDRFEPFAAYCVARLVEDPHVWATTLFDELLELGYDRSYPTFTRALRTRNLRPHCEPCRPAKDRPVAVIEHPPGDETPVGLGGPARPTRALGWGAAAHLLVGALAHSGRWRGWLSASVDSPHLIDGLDRVTRALGGCTIAWRLDRMATVINPESGRVQASFSAVAKHYGVTVLRDRHRPAALALDGAGVMVRGRSPKEHTGQGHSNVGLRVRVSRRGLSLCGADTGD